MDVIDADRFQGLVAALKNANDTSVPFATLHNAQGIWARSRADLEDFKERGPGGRKDLRNADVTASFERGVAELEARLTEADREVKRIEALQRQSAAQRLNLQRLLDGVKAWARQQSPPIMLPGDDVMSMGGFSPTSVHIPTPPGREFAQGSRGYEP